MFDSSLTIAVDLRPGFGAVRFQGDRPTCTAFAASDCHGYALGPGSDELSPEYAFFHGVERTAAKDRTEGLNLGAISSAIEYDGQPAETGWPYILDLLPDDDWSPPADPGPIHRRRLERISCDLGSVREELGEGRPVVLLTDITRSFYEPVPGTIINPPASERREITHAVIAVGFGYLDAAACYLIRNSWGAGWGTNGYVWLHRDYLGPRLRSAGVYS